MLTLSTNHFYENRDGERISSCNVYVVRCVCTYHLQDISLQDKNCKQLRERTGFNELDDKSKKKKIKKELKKYISFKEIRILDLIGSNMPDIDRSSLYEHMMIVIDYISGMTDRYATYLANRINGIV